MLLLPSRAGLGRVSCGFTPSLLSFCCIVCLFIFFFLRTFLYILYDTSLYRLFEDSDSSCQFGSFPNEIHPKVFLLLFSRWVE